MIWLGNYNFGKLEFLVKLQVIYIQTFKKSTIKLAFKRTELIFYNLKMVILQIRILLSSTQIITSSLSNPTKKIGLVYITTLHRLHKIKNQAILLINSIKRDQRLIYLKFQPYLNWFICGSVTNSS